MHYIHTHTYMHTHTHTHTHTCIHTHIHTYRHAYIYTCTSAPRTCLCEDHDDHQVNDSSCDGCEDLSMLLQELFSTTMDDSYNRYAIYYCSQNSSHNDDHLYCNHVALNMSASDSHLVLHIWRSLPWWFGKSKYDVQSVTPRICITWMCKRKVVTDKTPDSTPSDWERYPSSTPKF